jgi:hypothetical protein
MHSEHRLPQPGHQSADETYTKFSKTAVTVLTVLVEVETRVRGAVCECESVHSSRVSSLEHPPPLDQDRLRGALDQLSAAHRGFLRGRLHLGDPANTCLPFHTRSNTSALLQL